MHEFASKSGGICMYLHEFACICMYLHEFARICMNLHEFARICMNLHFSRSRFISSLIDETQRNAHFLDPSKKVVTLYEIVTRDDFYQSREWFRSLRSLNHNENYMNFI